MKEGDILYANLGVTMELPTWYKVTSATAKTVVVRELKHTVVEGDGLLGYSMPIQDEFAFNSAYKKCVVKTRKGYDGKEYEYVKVEYTHTATLWDGEKKYHNHLD